MYRTLQMIAAAALMAWPGAARADSNSHYQDMVVGERAAGMGGAFTALASEATGAHYNPAGIVAASSTVIQLSMSAYKLRSREVDVADLCGTKLSEDDDTFFSFPASFGFVKQFHTGSVHHGLGLTLVMPHTSKVGYSFLERDGKCGPLGFDIGGSQMVVDRVLFGGVSYAIQPWRFLQLGVTVGLSVRSATHTGLMVQRWKNPKAQMRPYISFLNADVSLWSLYFAAGVIVAPTERLRIGLSFTSPHVRLSGSGRLDWLEAQAMPAEWRQSALDVLDDAEFYWEVPFRLALGVAYSGDRFTVAADVTLHGAVAPYEVYTHARLPANTEVNARDVVVNGNLGGELKLPKGIVLRLGAFTNFSSEPDDEPLVDAERIHMFGGTFGGSWVSDKGSSLSTAVVVQYGRGEVTGYKLSYSGASFKVEQPRVRTEDLVVIVTVGGSYDLR